MSQLKPVPNPKLPGLAQALLQARSQLIGLEPDRVNDYTKVPYVSAEKTIRESKAALNSNGVLVSPIDNYVEEQFGRLFHVTIYKLEHAESGETEVRNFRLALKTEAKMGDDKAQLACMTSSWNYFLRDVLMIARTEDEIGGAPDEHKEGKDLIAVRSKSGNFDPENKGMRATFSSYCTELGIPRDAQEQRKQLAEQLRNRPMRLLKDEIQRLMKR